MHNPSPKGVSFAKYSESVLSIVNGQKYIHSIQNIFVKKILLRGSDCGQKDFFNHIFSNLFAISNNTYSPLMSLINDICMNCIIGVFFYQNKLY